MADEVKPKSGMAKKVGIGCLVILAFIVLVGIFAPTQNNDPSSSASNQGAVSDTNISLAKYSSLKTGMTYEQAVAILGTEGVEMSSNELAGHRTVMYQWDAGFGANMNAMFQDGKLIQKAQFGLR